MIIKLIHKCVKRALEIIFPITCFDCGKKNDSYLCFYCRQKIAPAKQFDSRKIKLIIFAASSYNNPVIRKIIWHFKYRGKYKLAEILAEIILQNFKLFTEISGADFRNYIFIPIPISKKKLKQRGYNQAGLIARALSEKTGIQREENVLFKKIDTLAQMEIKTKQERMSNLKGSFDVHPIDSANPSDKITIFLIDDVVTTGATLNEAARSLQAAGFKKIIGITAAT